MEINQLTARHILVTANDISILVAEYSNKGMVLTIGVRGKEEHRLVLENLNGKVVLHEVKE